MALSYGLVLVMEKQSYSVVLLSHLPKKYLGVFSWVSLSSENSQSMILCWQWGGGSDKEKKKINFFVVMLSHALFPATRMLDECVGL